MFDNSKVTPEAILNSHIGNAVYRADAFPVVLAVQDTWRIHWLTKLVREVEETPSIVVFSETEWKGLLSCGAKG